MAAKYDLPPCFYLTPSAQYKAEVKGSMLKRLNSIWIETKAPGHIISFTSGIHFDAKIRYWHLRLANSTRSTAAIVIAVRIAPPTDGVAFVGGCKQDTLAEPEILLMELNDLSFIQRMARISELTWDWQLVPSGRIVPRL